MFRSPRAFISASRCYLYLTRDAWDEIPLKIEAPYLVEPPGYGFAMTVLHPSRVGSRPKLERSRD